MIDPERLPSGLVVPVRVDRSREGEAADRPTLDAARGSGWRRTSRGFYVPADVDAADVRQRILEAAVLVPSGCAVTGWAALCWQGGRWFAGTDARGELLPVPLALGTRDLRKQPGIRLSGEGLGPRHVTEHEGLPITIPTYSVSYEMRYARDVSTAAAVLSMACYSDLVSIEEQSDFLTPGQNGWTGVPKARAAVNRASESLWSPAEQGFLDLWSADDRPAPAANRPIFDLTGRHLLTPDLLDVEHGVAGEYNGEEIHLTRQGYGADLGRWDEYRERGIEVVVMTAADRQDTSGLLRRLDHAYARAAVRTGTRNWTAEPPDWWVPTDTVAQRRALTEDQRARFLRHRSA